MILLGKPEVTYGGQAVIEGVMMRGPEAWAVAVRRPDNSIVVRREPLRALSSSGIWRRPLFRGMAVLYEALVIGIQALSYSAEQAVGEEERPVGRWEIAATVFLGIVLAVFLFAIIPAGLAYLARGAVSSGAGQNLLEGLVRLGVFLLYIVLVGLIPDIRRVFAYHGAEHRVINAYEAGAALTIEGVRGYPVLHPRCGTSFILVVLLLSILIFSFLGQEPLWWRLLSRVLFLPLIAGISYEFIKLAARKQGNAFCQFLVAPGLWLQRLTTREPDDAQVAVALAALDAVLVKEGDPGAGKVGQD
ncbi:DUF1385 domain-containing protein [Thermodesulfitimonas autotrophica]|uniref:DUF1385 domain-containing protein n=1 Tax=Thermodesulfitimonas autotrophica TaxID=1894989 RepID=UPI003CCC707A